MVHLPKRAISRQKSHRVMSTVGTCNMLLLSPKPNKYLSAFRGLTDKVDSCLRVVVTVLSPRHLGIASPWHHARLVVKNKPTPYPFFGFVGIRGSMVPYSGHFLRHLFHPKHPHRPYFFLARWSSRSCCARSSGRLVACERSQHVPPVSGGVNEGHCFRQAPRQRYLYARKVAAFFFKSRGMIGVF